VYNDLYREYLALHDYFGRGGTEVMTRLRRLHRVGQAETAYHDVPSRTLVG
jgi:L-ribulokinase